MKYNMLMYVSTQCQNMYIPYIPTDFHSSNELPASPEMSIPTNPNATHMTTQPIPYIALSILLLI